MKLHVIYRLCDKPESVNGLPRPLGMTKKQIIGVCLPSVIDSISTLGENWTMTVLADDVSDETKEFVKEATDKKAFLYDITEKVEQDKKFAPYPAGLMGTSGGSVGPIVRTVNYKTPLKNLGSLKKAYEVADSLTGDPEDTWVYFLEDDYLHDKNTFLPRFLDFVALAKARNFAQPVFYHPTDYPDQYTRLLSRCYVFQAVTGYFREVCSTTGTYMCQLKTYRQFADWIKDCSVDDGKFSTIFKKKAMCFSPMPGTTTHMHEGVMSAYVDWASIIYGMYGQLQQSV